MDPRGSARTAVNAVLGVGLAAVLALAIFAVPRWLGDDPREGLVESEELSAARVPGDLPQPVELAPPTREEADTQPPTPVLSPERQPPTATAPPDPQPAATPTDLFAEQMTAALTAEADGDFAAAAEWFSAALALRPESAAAADGLSRAERGRSRLELAVHRERGAALERSEQWTAALAEYEGALAVDPYVRFAVEGAARCRRRQALAERMEFHLAHRDRLASDAVLEEARALLEEAAAVVPRGPVLGAQIERLAHAVEVAETAVRVELASDGLTEVSIHHVGSLGTFTRRTVELRPGTYTVVGSRQGFRDVLIRLRVPPGGLPGPVTVQCTEGV